MADTFNAGGDVPKSTPQDDRYKPGPSENLIATMAVQMNAQLKEHDRAITTHDGIIKGIQTALSSVQGSVAAALTLGGIATAALVAISIFNVSRTNNVGDRVDVQTDRIAGVEVRLGAVDSQLKVLPVQVAHEIVQQQTDSRALKKRP